jgi:thymidylate kinase
MFVVLEGQNGTGKSAVIDVLKTVALTNFTPFASVEFTRHPGATPLGHEIRKMVVEKDHHIVPDDHLVRQSLYMVAMRDFCLKFGHRIRAPEVLLISDRYHMSTVVYGRQQGVDPQISKAFFHLLKCTPPHLTIVLTAAPSDIHLRLSRRPFKNKDIEYNLKYHESVGKLYQDEIEECNSPVVSVWTTGKDVIDVAHEVITIINQCDGGWYKLGRRIQ